MLENMNAVALRSIADHAEHGAWLTQGPLFHAAEVRLARSVDVRIGLKLPILRVDGESR